MDDAVRQSQLNRMVEDILDSDREWETLDYDDISGSIRRELTAIARVLLVAVDWAEFRYFHASTAFDSKARPQTVSVVGFTDHLIAIGSGAWQVGGQGVQPPRLFPRRALSSVVMRESRVRAQELAKPTTAIEVDLLFGDVSVTVGRQTADHSNLAAFYPDLLQDLANS